MGTLAFVLLGANAAVLLTGAARGDTAAPPPTTTTTAFSATSLATTTTTTTAPPTRVVPASTDLASPKGEVPTYDAPGGNEIGRVGYFYGWPQTTPIVEERGKWLRIMLPERPNESTAWVRADSVKRSVTKWYMVVDLSETRVFVYKDGVEQWSAPLGIGKDHTRTPTGSYYVAVRELDVGHGYGPIVLDLSAHSEDIQSWAGSGDAITAFHGPFGAESILRSGGGKVSNGCLRMLPEDQIKMMDIPVGTPVDILP